MAMEISMQMNLNTIKMVSTTSKLGFRQENVRATISCRVVDNLAMESGKTNFYKLLSLDSENVGMAEIKKAYRRMVLQCHPDVCPDPSAKEESTKRFLQLQMAYETLSDPVSRKMYDYQLGLVNPIGFGFGNCLMEESRPNFQRDIKKRSHVGLQRMKNRSR